MLGWAPHFGVGPTLIAPHLEVGPICIAPHLGVDPHAPPHTLRADAQPRQGEGRPWYKPPRDTCRPPPQWAVVGDTFPVGCKVQKSVVFGDTTFHDNPDTRDPLYR